MAREIDRYEAYANDIRRLLIASGLWPGPVSWSLFRFLSAFHVCAALATTIAIFYFVANHISNFALATKGLSVSFSLLSCMQKVIILTINRDHLKELHVTLEETFRQDLANAELRSSLLSAIAWFHRPTLVHAVSVYLLMPLHVIAPTISILVQLAHGVRPIKYHLPFPTKYPWPTDSSILVYTAHYLAEIFAGIAVVTITAGTDILFGFYVFQMTAQFRALSYRMSNLKATDDHQTVVRECVSRHQILTECRDRLEVCFGPVILWMLMTSAVIICALIYQFSKMTPGMAAVSIVYIVGKMLQTLLYAYYGMSLTTETEVFRDAVYSSGWPGSSEKSLMTSVLIMVQCKPLILTACKFSPIGLDMFLGIVNTAVSYFFLLQTLEEK